MKGTNVTSIGREGGRRRCIFRGAIIDILYREADFLKGARKKYYLWDECKHNKRTVTVYKTT